MYVRTPPCANGVESRRLMMETAGPEIKRSHILIPFPRRPFIAVVRPGPSCRGPRRESEAY